MATTPDENNEGLITFAKLSSFAFRPFAFRPGLRPEYWARLRKACLQAGLAC